MKILLSTAPIFLVLLSILQLTTSQNRRTTPPRLPRPGATQGPTTFDSTTTITPITAIITTTTTPISKPTIDGGSGGSGGGAVGQNTPVPQGGGNTLLNTPSPANAGSTMQDTPTPDSGAVTMADTPTPDSAAVTMADTPTADSGAVTMADTPVPQGGGTLPSTPATNAGSSLPGTPPANGGGNGLPSTPVNIPILPQTPTPNDQGANTLPQTPPPGVTLPTTPQGQQGITLPQTPPTAATVLPPLPVTPSPNVGTVQATLGTTPASSTNNPLFTTPPPILTIPTVLIVTTPVVTTTTTAPVPTVTTTTAKVVIITTNTPTTTTKAGIVTTPTVTTTTASLITTPTPGTTTTTILGIVTTSAKGLDTTPKIESTLAQTTSSPLLASSSTPLPLSNPPSNPSSNPPSNPPSTTPLIPIEPSSMFPPPSSNSFIDTNDANIMFLLCNDFKLIVPANDLGAYLGDIDSKIRTIIKAEDPTFREDRLVNVRLSENIDNAKLTLEFTIRPGRSNEIKSSKIVTLVKSKTLKDKSGNTFETNCGGYRILSWGEKWKCPDQFCVNDGFCRVRSNGRHYCDCSSGYMGQYCGVNLWPLIVLPILFVLAAIMILCCCLYRRKQRRVVVKNFINVEEPEPVKVEEVVKERPKPMQTFYLPYNKPLSVGFTEGQLGNVGMRPGVPMRGVPMMSGMGGGVNIMPNPHAIYPAMGRTIVDDPEIYYQSMGQKMALAYNDYTFVPNPRASSAGNVVFHGQTNQACNGCNNSNNLVTSFSSTPADNDVANDGSGYYHELGQKLAINFDSK